MRFCNTTTLHPYHAVLQHCNTSPISCGFVTLQHFTHIMRFCNTSPISCGFVTLQHFTHIMRFCNTTTLHPYHAVLQLYYKIRPDWNPQKGRCKAQIFFPSPPTAPPPAGARHEMVRTAVKCLELHSALTANLHCTLEGW